VATRRTADRADAREKTPAKAKQCIRPPWGNILGGEPIERQGWHFDSKVDLGEDYVQQEQYARMLRLKKHYQKRLAHREIPPIYLILLVGAQRLEPWTR